MKKLLFDGEDFIGPIQEGVFYDDSDWTCKVCVDIANIKVYQFFGAALREYQEKAVRDSDKYSAVCEFIQEQLPGDK